MLCTSSGTSQAACFRAVRADRKAGLAGHLEHVVGEVEVADLGVPVNFPAGAVLVDVRSAQFMRN